MPSEASTCGCQASQRQETWHVQPGASSRSGAHQRVQQRVRTRTGAPPSVQAQGKRIWLHPSILMKEVASIYQRAESKQRRPSGQGARQRRRTLGWGQLSTAPATHNLTAVLSAPDIADSREVPKRLPSEIAQTKILSHCCSLAHSAVHHLQGKPLENLLKREEN